MTKVEDFDPNSIGRGGISNALLGILIVWGNPLHSVIQEP